MLYYQYKKRYGNDIIIKFYPFYGILHYFQESFVKHNDSTQCIKDIMTQYPKAKGMLYLSGFSGVLILTSNEWIKILSQNQQAFFKQKSGFGLNYFFFKGLVHADGLRWKRQRQFLNSTFHINSISNKFQLMKDTVVEFENGLQSGNEFYVVDPMKQFQNYTSEIVVKSFFGQSFKDVKCNGVQFIHEFVSLAGQMMRYRLSPYFVFKKTFLGYNLATDMFNTTYAKSLIQRIKNLNGIVTNFIETRLEKLVQNNIKELEPQNFLDLLLKEYYLQMNDNSYKNLQEYEKITYDEIIQQFYTFLLTGTDTSSQLLAMTFFELSRDPECLEKVKQEIKDNNITFNTLKITDLSKLNYMTTVLKESLRLHPVLPTMINRQSNNDFQEGDLFISKHLTVASRFVNNDQSKPFFQNPEAFDPSRFAHADKIDPFDFIPFSSGSRNCIGQHMALQEVKIIMIYVLENFEIKKLENYVLKKNVGLVQLPIDKKMFMIKRKIK